jgi:hypothetical protein
MASVGRSLAQRDCRRLDGPSAGRSTLVRRFVRIAENHGDILEADIELISHDLTETCLHSRTHVHVAAKCGYLSVLGYLDERTNEVERKANWPTFRLSCQAQIRNGS